ncbi:MAG: Tetracycline resistance protein, class C [Chlamydiae bacterium]|nr:Tetracycline resistance protein, class C [Chlamydiota bacterium]
MTKRSFSFFLLLGGGFLDYFGIGLVFPLFSKIAFDSSLAFLDPGTSDAMRGLWMGLLIALTPIVQFFASPFLGSLSDRIGRRPIILAAACLATLSYGVAALGILQSSLVLLLLYRALFGVCAATVNVAQAAVIDLSGEEGKASSLSYFNMALGLGFMMGPFLGGRLADPALISWFSLITPFVFSAAISAVNCWLLFWKLKETRKGEKEKPLGGLQQLFSAFVYRPLRGYFLAFFLFFFGWDFFMEFAPVFLMKRFALNTAQIGNFYAYVGFAYALLAGFAARPIVKRFAPKVVLYFTMVAGGICLLVGLLIRSPVAFLWYLPALCFCLALYYPASAAFVSDSSSENRQGEVLGMFGSIQALALVLSPLFTGAFIGRFPAFPLLMGGLFMLFGAGVFAVQSASDQKGDAEEAG